ncbi:hypothetical protein PSTG_11018 [Puccinia striiformis f. sp. tritici PST-78]|uniref:CxC1-like cysteine cluster associated with KDZ transposases domain-containing protein n=1 Tax=Puccinia striiformis f. sp. tritici PST-78 TaxID=1165861 RepID=A0A0L0V8P1_9BASI|nr:hypothetical protein PSTG_11018 [Puccinia striiformis f. sp. tritici PST-78]
MVRHTPTPGRSQPRPSRPTPGRSQPRPSRSTPTRPPRTTRINPFRHETPLARTIRLRNEERNRRSLLRLEALHRGELPMPSSSRALRAHLAALESGNNPNDRSNESDTNVLPQTHLWDQPDDDEGQWETYEHIPAPRVSSLSQRIFDTVAARRRERLTANWNRNIPQLHGVYMYLKVNTGNWTFENCFDSFENLFCSCTHFKYRTIDIYDLMSQKRIRQRFCKCIPDVVRLLALGYIGSSPIRPKTAFSVRLLQFHNLLWHWCNIATFPFTEMLSRWLEEQSPKILNPKCTKRRELRRCFSAAVDIFRAMLLKTSEIVDSALQLSKTETFARQVCPGCFGSIHPEDPYQPRSSVKNALHLCLDANFQHRHNAKAGGAAPLILPPLFVEPKRVDRMRDDIATLATPDEPVDPCSESHQAANDKRCETTWKGCDDTGIMGCCCRHDQVVYLANIHHTGEQRCLPLAILKKIFEDIEATRPVGVLYDIGCALDKFLRRRDFFAFPSKKDYLKFGTSVFHAYVHEWKCQVKYNPRFNAGWGLSDGEGLERLWSSLSPLFHNLEGRISMMTWLRKKYVAAKLRRREANKTLTDLFQRPNPFSNDGGNYTRHFFTTQWEHQVNYLDRVTNEDTDRRKRTVLDTREWDVQAELIERITEEITNSEGSQRQLAEELGILYGANATDIDKEKRKLLIWSSKRELYAKAVDIQGVRQPIVESQTRGRRVGTRLKEKIYKSIKKRKTTVTRIITRYNERYEAYLHTYDPLVLANPSFASLTWDTFKSLKLDDPFWDDTAFHGSQSPWALSSDVREGIRASHMLERAEEELDLIAQELGRAMTWARPLFTDELPSKSSLPAYTAGRVLGDPSRPVVAWVKIRSTRPLEPAFWHG